MYASASWQVGLEVKSTSAGQNRAESDAALYAAAVRDGTSST